MASWIAALAPLGEGVVVPAAGHRFLPWSSWPQRGAGEIFAALVTLARGRDDQQRVLAPEAPDGSGRSLRTEGATAGEPIDDLGTRGLRLFGVPEMAAAIAGDPDAARRALFDAAFEAAWRGFVPKSTARLEAHVDRSAGAWQVRRVAVDGTWIEDRGGDAGPFTLRAGIAHLVGAHLFDDPSRGPGDASVGLFASTERRLASTLDVHRTARAKGPLEIVAFSPRLSRHAVYAIRQVAAVVRASPDALDAYHRVALPPLEPAGIAGVVLWPSGQLPLASASVALLEAFPVTPDELARFRAGGQGAWMDEIEARSAFARLQARWCGA